MSRQYSLSSVLEKIPSLAHGTGEVSEIPAKEQNDVAIKNVAVATDFSRYSERAVQHAVAVARHFGATLHLLHIVRPSEFAFVPDVVLQIEEASNRECKELSARIHNGHQLSGLDCRRWVERGEVFDVVGRFVKDQSIDLLVIGTRGRSGVARLVLGSVAQAIFHCVRCPVLTVGPQAPGTTMNLQLERILFATDLSRQSLEAIPYVRTAMRAWHTKLDVLHVCTDAHSGHAELLNAVQKRIGEVYDGIEPGSTKCNLTIGEPAKSVLDFAARNKENLIVLGLKAHRSLYSSPFWSDAYTIVRNATCPVLSIRSTDS
jgi:nucleotide-binding universal stress UspA family protein